MAMTCAEIEMLLGDAFPDARILVTDLAGDGDHFSAEVTCAAFKGKSRVQQHQMVYAALKGGMDGALHALAVQTCIPD
ncbi:MAG: BolA family transcriptional regulator [Acidocella sp.]|nr:BolA family transcriptional regulator [Acidocella sp.]